MLRYILCRGSNDSSSQSIVVSIPILFVTPQKGETRQVYLEGFVGLLSVSPLKFLQEVRASIRKSLSVSFFTGG